LLNATAFFIL